MKLLNNGVVVLEMYLDHEEKLKEMALKTDKYLVNETNWPVDVLRIPKGGNGGAFQRPHFKC